MPRREQLQPGWQSNALLDGQLPILSIVEINTSEPDKEICRRDGIGSDKNTRGHTMLRLNKVQNIGRGIPKSGPFQMCFLRLRWRTVRSEEPG